MYSKSCMTILLAILASPPLLHAAPSEKQVFVYKTVQGHEIKANLFLPDVNDRCPVLVYLHGGGFIFGNRDRGLPAPLKTGLLPKGIAIVSADYRLAPETKLKEIMQDARDVVTWLRNEGQQRYPIDPKRIAVAGGSAGGYLALASGFEKESAPDAIIPISSPMGFDGAVPLGDLSLRRQPGPYDIVQDTPVSYGDYDERMTLWRFLAKHRLIQYEIFGFDPHQEADKLGSYQLQTNVGTDFPPTLIVHARNDHLVDLAQAKRFHALLKEKGVASDLCLVENGHSSRLFDRHPEVVGRIASFLEKHWAGL